MADETKADPPWMKLLQACGLEGAAPADEAATYFTYRPADGEPLLRPWTHRPDSPPLGKWRLEMKPGEAPVWHLDVDVAAVRAAGYDLDEFLDAIKRVGWEPVVPERPSE